jgi:hypothetical protein
VPQKTFKRSEKDEFLDNYFVDQLQNLIIEINGAHIKKRKVRVQYILDTLLCIADEYQAVMVEQEHGYWSSIENWKDEDQQRKALKFVMDTINNKEGS